MEDDDGGPPPGSGRADDDGDNVDSDANLLWTKYTEDNDERAFRQYVKSFVERHQALLEHQGEQQPCGPPWRVPSLSELPDELLAALSKFIFVAKDEVEQGCQTVMDLPKLVADTRRIADSLTIICLRTSNIPLVGSMAFVAQLTQMVNLLLEHLLQMESAFFDTSGTPPVKTAGKTNRNGGTGAGHLRQEIVRFIISSCRFLEAMYDPSGRWRNFLNQDRGEAAAAATTDMVEDDVGCPVSLHQDTVPFLYESFETAMVESFPEIGVEMLSVLGAVMSGSRYNSICAISPATFKMLQKTVRDGGPQSVDLQLAAARCSVRALELVLDTPEHERQLDAALLARQLREILLALATNPESGSGARQVLVFLSGLLVRTAKTIAVAREGKALELRLVLARGDTVLDGLLEAVEKCRLAPAERKVLIPEVIDCVNLVLKDCDFACDKMARRNGYGRLLNAVDQLGPPDTRTLEAVLRMATHEVRLDAWSSDQSACFVVRTDFRFTVIKNVEPVVYLLKWIGHTGYENPRQQVWLTETLRSLCTANMQNMGLCCRSEVVVEAIHALRRHWRLDQRSAFELLRCIQCLGSHSISPYELKLLIGLLKSDEHVPGSRSGDGDEDEDNNVGPFPYKGHVLHVISSMAKGSGYEVCRSFFDFPAGCRGIEVLNLDKWSGPGNGFSFHCWIRLDPLPDEEQRHQPRRMVYSFYSANGNGFEAFVSAGRVLVLAVAHKKEFLAVPLEDHPLASERWHSVDVVHSPAKRPFGSSHLQVWLDGTKRLECALKYPNTLGPAEPLVLAQLGSPPSRHHHHQQAVVLTEKSRGAMLKEGIGDAIKVGLAGVRYIPQSLKKSAEQVQQSTTTKASSGSPVRWTLIGLEDQLWGKPVALVGQMGMICCFQESLSPGQVKLLHDLGPNKGLNLAAAEAPPAGRDPPQGQQQREAVVQDTLGKLLFFYSAKVMDSYCQTTTTTTTTTLTNRSPAAAGNEGFDPRAGGLLCPNLHPWHPWQQRPFDALCFVKAYSVHDVKDVINCLGGVQMLFPILESPSFILGSTAATTTTNRQRSAGGDDDFEVVVGHSRRSRRSRTKVAEEQPEEFVGPNPDEDAGGEEWEVVPMSSFSDWNLEQNPVSGFLVLVKNLLARRHSVNAEQLTRVGGVHVMGYLLQRCDPALIDVNVLMAVQLLVEAVEASWPATAAGSSSSSSSLLFQIYQSVLFDFRIWSKCEYTVQIGHVQYLSTLIKQDRNRYFRRYFGVQFLLDVVRKHYTEPGCSNNGAKKLLDSDDRRSLRASILNLVRTFMQKDVTAASVVLPIVNFVLAVKDRDGAVPELLETLSDYLSSSSPSHGKSASAKEQMFLILHESRRADLLYCLLLLQGRGRSPDHDDDSNGPFFRERVMRLISILLKYSRVNNRHKRRLNLQDASGHAGYFSLRFKDQAPDLAEVVELFEQMVHPSVDGHTKPGKISGSCSGILALAHHLQWALLGTKVEFVRLLMTFLFGRAETPVQFAKVVGWQDCLCRLLVKKRVSHSHHDSILEAELPVAAASSLDDTSSSSSPLRNMAEAVVGRTVAENVSQVKSLAKGRVSDTVLRTQGMVVSAHDMVSDRVTKTIDLVASGIDNISEMALKKGGQLLSPVKEYPTAYYYNSVYSFFGPDEMAAAAPLHEARSPTAVSRTSDDASKANDDDGNDDELFDPEAASLTSMETVGNDVPISLLSELPSDLQDCRVSGHGGPVRGPADGPLTAADGDNDEDGELLCDLLVNILFTVMWRGVSGLGLPLVDAVKERGQVVACINMLGLNNELYSSHVELKRRLVELCLQAVLLELKGAVSQGDLQQGLVDQSLAQAEHVIKWVYDIVVLDGRSGVNGIGKKVNEVMLDAVIGLVEVAASASAAFGSASSSSKNMTKMALEILLAVAEGGGSGGGDKAAPEAAELCAAASAKLHSLMLTKEDKAVVKEECAFVIYRVCEAFKGQSCCRPLLSQVMRTALEKVKSQFQLTTQLPSLNLQLLRRLDQGSVFAEFFEEYRNSEEWNYFVAKRVRPEHDAFRAGFLSRLPLEMDQLWSECYELAKVASHSRLRQVGEAKLKFVSRYLEPYKECVKAENGRFNNLMSQQGSHLVFFAKRWQAAKRLHVGPRGVWGSKRTCAVFEDHWRISSNENFMRMRLKLLPNLRFDPHLAASRLRDNAEPPPTTKSSGRRGRPEDGVGEDPMELGANINRDALSAAAAAARVTEEDGLTEEDLKNIAIEQMETLASQGVPAAAADRLLFSVECELVTFMSVVKGRMELTTKYVYFFDSSPWCLQGTSAAEQGRDGVVDDGDVPATGCPDRHDFRWSLPQLREMHLRRFNLRRTGIEFFLLDQTSYFLNFGSHRGRNTAYSKVAGLKPPNLTYSGGGSKSSPADVLKASGWTRRWVDRKISNFEYLMQLNTIAGRTYNDLSQYPVFPWILADYTSHALDLTEPRVFRDLSKPVGVQNPRHAKEVKERYDNFEDPTGTVAKFHYGTHYSNSALVLHYLVRLEPYTSLHVELQSGRFDVADRQFHSVGQSWKSVLDNANDVKELIPEFFYLPEFLLNLNNFDLGRLQGGRKDRLGDVVLPRWAKNAHDFVRKNRQALESDHVSGQLHHWIDLIFGYKQKGPAAVQALNVFYYCSYEGAVDLDAVKDESERVAIEGMINNFGQVPCQLLKEPHPVRRSEADCASSKSYRPDVLALAPDWKPYLVPSMADEADPLTYVAVVRPRVAPGGGSASSSSFFLGSVSNNPTYTLVTVSSRRATVGAHSWTCLDRGSAASSLNKSDFLLEVDPQFQVGGPEEAKSNSSWTGGVVQGQRGRVLPGLFPQATGRPFGPHLFQASSDAKYVFSGGHWDNSLRVYSLAKSKTVCAAILHIGVVTCLCLDKDGCFIMSGSEDTTSIVWEVSLDAGDTSSTTSSGAAAAASTSSTVGLRPVQVLSGHDKKVTCVCLSVELDMAVSGSGDGTVNVYTVKEGQYVRTLLPMNFDPDPKVASFTVTQMALSYQGHVVVSGHSKEAHSLVTFTVNGHVLHADSAVLHRITSLVISEDHILTGDENGDLILRDLFTGEVLHSLPLHLPVQSACLCPDKTHLLVPLRDGSLVVIGASLPPLLPSTK